MAERESLSLPRLAPHAPADQQGLAQRIDYIFRELETFLRDYAAPNTQNVGSVPSGQLTDNRTIGVFIQTFESAIEDYWDQRTGDTTNISYPTDGSAGGKVFKATGHKRFDYPENIPYDSTRIYRFRARVKITTKDGDAGTDNFRWGWVGYDADGTTVVDRDGGTSLSKPHVVGASRDMSGDTLDTFVEIEAYVKGTNDPGSSAPGGVTTPGKIHPEVNYVRPFFEVNYDGGESGVMEVDYIAFDILTQDQEIDALNTINAPAESGAEQTTGKSLTLLTDRVPSNVGAEPAITKGASEPSSPDTGDLWLDTSHTPDRWKQWDGSKWTRAYVVSGDIGPRTGLSFNGDQPSGANETNGHHVEAPSLDASHPTTTWTVEGWARLDVTDQTGNGASFFDTAGNEGNDAISIQAINKEIRVNTGGQWSAISEPHEKEAGEWFHWAVRYDNSGGVGDLELLINQEVVGTATGISEPTVESSEKTVMGRRNSHFEHTLKGDLDEIRVWNTYRTDDEIKKNAELRLDGDESGLVANWRFDEGDGLTAGDVTGNFDGTLTAESGADLPKWTGGAIVGTPFDALELLNGPAESGAEKTAGHSITELTGLEPENVGAEPKIKAQASAPSDTDVLWLDTSGGEPYTWRRYDGTTWVRATREDGDVDSLQTQNAPAESGAETTTGKSITVMVDRYLDALERAAGNSTKLSEILAKMDDVGDMLSSALFDDGAGKRKFLVGRQGGEHADGASIVFEDVFQNAPTIIFSPSGRLSEGLGGGGGSGDPWGLWFDLPIIPGGSSGSSSVKFYDYVRADGLTASGFDLVAKVIERDITTAAVSDAFSAGTITSEGGTHALGGLSSGAWDDEYETIYDITLNVNSTDSLQDIVENFASGSITAAGNSKSLDDGSIDYEDNSGYTAKYDFDMSVTSAETSESEAFPAGIIDAIGETKEITLSETAHDGHYEAKYEYSLEQDPATTDLGDPWSASITIAVDKHDGSSWVEAGSQTHSASDSTGAKSDISASLSFTDTNITSGDKVRLRVKDLSETDGVAEADPTSTDYTSIDAATLEIVVAVDVDTGSGFVEKDTNTHTVTDNTGSGASDSDTGETLSIADADATKGDNVRIRLKSASITSGTADSSSQSVDPTTLEYQTGTVETATITVEVAIDSKDGSDAWVERKVATHSLTDDTGSGKSKTVTGASKTFISSAIASGDDVRVRAKSVTVDGSADSSSFSIDPDSVDYTEKTGGSTTEHSKTPDTGDNIKWEAVAG